MLHFKLAPQKATDVLCIALLWQINTALSESRVLCVFTRFVRTIFSQKNIVFVPRRIFKMAQFGDIGSSFNEFYHRDSSNGESGSESCFLTGMPDYAPLNSLNYDYLGNIITRLL